MARTWGLHEQAVVEGTWGRRCVVGLWGRFWNREQRLWKEVVGDGWGRRTDVSRSVSSPGQGRGLGDVVFRTRAGRSVPAGLGGRRVPGHRPAEALRRSTMVGQALSWGVCGGAGLLLPRRLLSFPTHAKVT